MIYVYRKLFFLIELTVGELVIYVYDANTKIMYCKHYYDKWNPINNITKVSMKDVYKMIINFFENPRSRVYLEIIFENNKLKLEFTHNKAVYDIKFDFTLYRDYCRNLHEQLLDCLKTNIDFGYFRYIDDNIHDLNKSKRIKETIVLE